MESIVAPLAESHSFSFVGVAAGICAITAWLLLSLLERAETGDRRHRLRWMTAAALVAGLGVWTTHFIAMLGFRPDFLFGFDPGVTVLSALVAVALTGLPLASTAWTRRRSVHVASGAIGGVGVAAMHYTGMNALRGCVAVHAPAVVVLSGLAGVVLLAGAFSIRSKRSRKAPAAALIVAAVCLVHFTGMSGLTLEPEPDTAVIGVDQVTLGMIMTVVVLCFFLTAFVSAVSSAKLDEQTRQGTLLNAALTNMSNGLLLIGPDGLVTLLNDRLLRIFGIDERHVAVGMRWQDYLSHLGPHLGWDPARTRRVIDNHALWFERADTTYLEHVMDDGRVISVACRRVAGGGAVLTYDDVTVERAAQKSVERLAFIDPLTDLANRRAFQGELEAVLDAGESVALLLIDLDHFKSINDTLGHAVGDELLVKVGNRLRAACSRGEVIARLGGDELAIFSLDPDDAYVSRLAAGIVADIARSFRILQHTIVIGCSVGTATTADARDAATLLQYADLALYRAKARGRSQWQRYEVGMQEVAHERLRIEADLRHALSAGQFSLVYQPQIRFPDRRIVGFEALVRWNHPERGPISPDRFIPIAEETGIIRELGDWILTEACREAAGWPVDVHIAVNVSPVQLRNEAFPLQVARMLGLSGLAPSRLEVELTETALVEDGDRIAASLQALRELGIQVAMDDFGTGYSSFAHLVDFDLDRIKIDRTFVQAAPEKASAMAVVKAVIQMAHDIGVGTIGEGVESADQLDLLQSLGCDAVQGYLTGRPMNRCEAAHLLRMQEGPPAIRHGTGPRPA